MHSPPAGSHRAADPSRQELLPNLRDKIDANAATWSREQKDACTAQTPASFKYGGSMLKYLREPLKKA